MKECLELAEKVRLEYNPEGLYPFPYENVERGNEDLSIIFTEIPNEISGAIAYDVERNQFVILINKNKPQTRQNFTVAHELGHYFLHKDIIKSETIVDGDSTLEGRTLFRLDDGESTKVETQANNFAASLIMPEEQVRRVWSEFKSIEECAEIFKVSALAMTIRLTKLKLVTE